MLDQKTLEGIVKNKGRDYSKYGLSSVDASSSNPDKGIVGDGQGNFYKIDGFERQQKEGLDTDAGKVFSSSLEADSGIDVTTFNTASDVEKALQALAGGGAAKDSAGERAPIKLSSRMQQSKDLVETARDNDLSGATTEMIFGERGKLGDFTVNYKQGIKDTLRRVAPKTEEEVLMENADPNSIM